MTITYYWNKILPLRFKMGIDNWSSVTFNSYVKEFTKGKLLYIYFLKLRMEIHFP